MSKKYTIELTEEEINFITDSLSYLGDHYGTLSVEMMKCCDRQKYAEFREKKMNLRILREKIKQAFKGEPDE